MDLNLDWPVLATYFFGGAFPCNAVPHFVAGVSGRPAQSLSAKPPGEDRRRRG